MVVAAVVLVGAVVLPADGVGFELCLFKRTSGLPCPGCGLTRSVRALAHAELAASFAFHALGSLVFLWALVAASSSVWPRGLRCGIDARLTRHERGTRRLGAVLLLLFLGYGLVRACLVAFGAWPSIW